MITAAETQAPSSALPIGVSRTVSDTELLPIDLTLLKSASQLINRILAISQAEDDAGDEAIVSSPVLGFVYMYGPTISLSAGSECSELITVSFL